MAQGAPHIFRTFQASVQKGGWSRSIRVQTMTSPGSLARGQWFQLVRALTFLDELAMPDHGVAARTASAEPKCRTCKDDVANSLSEIVSRPAASQLATGLLCASVRYEPTTLHNRLCPQLRRAP